MLAHKLRPSLRFGHHLITNRTEIFQQAVRTYESLKFSNRYLGCQGYWQRNVTPCRDNINRSQHIPINRGDFNRVISRSLQFGKVCFVNKYQHFENEYAHSILRSLPAYSATTVSYDSLDSADHPHTVSFSGVDWEKCSSEEVANGFIALSQLCRSHDMKLEDKQYSILCHELSKRLSHLDDQQLFKVFSSLILWPQTAAPTTPNFISLWSSLDEVCLQRMSTWDMSKMFLMADHWYTLKLSRKSAFNSKMIKDLAKSVGSMEPKQLVQYLFYGNLSRESMPYVTMSKIEKRLSEILEYVSIEELGIIVMGFFKTKTFLKGENLIGAIIYKTQENLETVSDITLTAILKILRKSVPPTKSHSLYMLLDSLKLHLHRLNHMCLLQAALLGNDSLVLHKDVIDEIVSVFSSEMKVLRLKDLERIAFALMLYNFLPPSCPDIATKIAEELRRKERISEIEFYTKSFVSCVVYLVKMGRFEPDLVSAALEHSISSLSKRTRSLDHLDMSRDALTLDWSVEIEAPVEYSGNRLDPALRTKLTKTFTPKLPSIYGKDLTFQEKLLCEVQDKLAAMLGGTNYVLMKNVLPHDPNPDLVFCTTKDGEPVEIPRKYLDLGPATLKYPTLFESDLCWNVVIVGGRNTFIRNTNLPQGNVQMKIRQLKTLGYQSCVVPFMDINKKKLGQKLACLERILYSESTLNTSGCVQRAHNSLQGRSFQKYISYL